MEVSLKSFIKAVEGEVLTPAIDIEKVVITDGYVSDLLSDVMGSAKENQVWITIMKHLNSVAVASLVNIPCIAFSKNIRPEKEVIVKAEEEGICLISSPLSSFEVSGRLYLLLRQVTG